MDKVDLMMMTPATEQIYYKTFIVTSSNLIDVLNKKSKGNKSETDTKYQFTNCL